MGRPLPAVGPDALASLLGATVIDLEQPRRAGMPVLDVHRPGTVFGLHRRHEPGGERRTSASGTIWTTEHAGTHVDALCHQAEDLRLHGGVEVTPAVQTSTGFTVHGIETVAPILARGVLLDLPRHEGGPLAPDDAIGAERLRAAAAAGGVEITPGCVVLVRTGYGAHWDDPPRYLRAPGIDVSGSTWLAELGVRAVGADNVVWDVPGAYDETTCSTLPGHVVLLVRAGVLIVENLNLEALAAAAPSAFAFVCLPLKLEGGTGSPVRPVALLPGD
ncbi:MAG TPA: cyclase family protein [Conexibacter sp.]|nr:cyclase family protein [Conexibacter sp.]